MVHKAYKLILFDLDHTLWDYHRNADEALGEIFTNSLPHFPEISLNRLIEIFKAINDQLWTLYHEGKIRQMEIRTLRFEQFLDHLGIKDAQLSQKLSDEYIELGPKKKHLFPNTHEVLSYLKEKYPLMIITNGFEGTQHKKVANSKIDHYFKEIITSERTGIQKPSSKIFQFALDRTGHKPEEAIMIGDNLETDIGGGINAGIDTVHFNPYSNHNGSRANFNISDLSELKNIL